MSSLIVEVCKVEDVFKHPNADRLSVVRVRGWHCIVGLDQYKIGDLVVFVPPDSIVPQKLIDKYGLTYLKNGGRVGTTKLRGFISQGLILDLPKGNWKEGDDVAKVLGITKYKVPDPPVMRGIKQVSKKKLNPLFDKYTDIENIKHYNNLFEDGEMIVITEKIHGSNARFGNLEIHLSPRQPLFFRIKTSIEKYLLRRTHQFIYGSHNVQITGHSGRNSFYGDDVWGKVATKYDLAKIIPEDYIIYGEIYGKGIQDLTYGLNDIDLVVFDVKYKNQYMDWDFAKLFCEERGLKTVPELYRGQYSSDVLDRCTKGNSLLCPTQIREGCVIKPLAECNHPKIGRKILKSINPEYLLRKNATEFK